MSEKGKIVVETPKKTTIRTIHDLVALMQPEAEEFLLPSKGILYGFDKVKIRPMTSKEEKKIASVTARNFNQQMISVLKNTVIEPEDFNPLELTIGDYTSLITKLRIFTYGSEYIVEVPCPNCKAISREVYDLYKLDSTWLDENFKEPYEIKLSNNVSVLLRLMRVRDDVEIDQIIQKKRKLQNVPAEDEWSYRYAKTIVTIYYEGKEVPNLTFNDKILFFESLKGKDAKKIRDFHAMFDHGIDLRVPYKCRSCEFESDKMVLRIDASFFIPTLLK